MNKKKNSLAAASVTVGLCGLTAPELARYRRVLGRAFANLVVVTSADDFFDRHGHGVLIISLSDANWRIHLARAHTRPHARVVALVGRRSEIDVAALYYSGVAAVVGVAEQSAVLVSVTRLVAEDMTMVPRKHFLHDPISDADVDLLAQLGTPCSVRELAARSYCSERTMYRRLRLLYDKLGVRGRTDAVRFAAEVKEWLHGCFSPV